MKIRASEYQVQLLSDLGFPFEDEPSDDYIKIVKDDSDLDTKIGLGASREIAIPHPSVESVAQVLEDYVSDLDGTDLEAEELLATLRSRADDRDDDYGDDGEADDEELSAVA